MCAKARTLTDREISGMPAKSERIRIRCDPGVFIEFKRVAAEFKTQEEAIKALIELYKQIDRSRIGPRIK